MALQISDIQAALASDNIGTTPVSGDGYINRLNIAEVYFDPTSGDVTGVVQFLGNAHSTPEFLLSVPSSDTTGTQIQFQTYNPATGSTGLPTVGTIIAFDSSNVVLQASDAQGDTIYYMISDAVFTSNEIGQGNMSVTDLWSPSGPGASNPQPTSYTAPAVCFAEGTRIRTERGEVAVEHLVEGDQVIVVGEADVAARPVIWIGRRHMNLVQGPIARRGAADNRPVRIRRDAFAAGSPGRDLLLSPGHAVFLDGVLVPAELLINGGSIVRETLMTAVTYYHVELDRHAVLLAENLASESYLDTGNRGWFENGGTLARIDATADAAGPIAARALGSCAPFAVAPEVVEPIWRRLAARARTLGHDIAMPETTDDPALRLLANGREMRPVSNAGGEYVFIVPPRVDQVRLLSRAARITETRPWQSDPRPLGVAVSRIGLRDRGGFTDLALDGPRCGAGWWNVEHDGARMFRWTNGDALIRLPECGTAGRALEIVVVGTVPYPLPRPDRPREVLAAA